MGLAAVSATSMALDENVRGALSQKDWAQAWEHGQDHLPLWGPLRSGIRDWKAGDHIGAGLNAAALGIEALGLKGALKGRGKGAAGKVKDENAGDGGKMGKLPKVDLPQSSKLPFDADSVLKNATEANRNGLTNAGRGLQKHIGRGDDAFKKIPFSHKTADQQAIKIVEEILNTKNPIKRIMKNGTHEIYDSVTKRGFSISREGKFNGFRTLDNVVE